MAAVPHDHRAVGRDREPGDRQGRVGHLDVHQAARLVGPVEDLAPLVRAVRPGQPDGPGLAADGEDDVLLGLERAVDPLLAVHGDLVGRHRVERRAGLGHELGRASVVGASAGPALGRGQEDREAFGTPRGRRGGLEAGRASSGVGGWRATPAEARRASAGRIAMPTSSTLGERRRSGLGAGRRRPRRRVADGPGRWASA